MNKRILIALFLIFAPVFNAAAQSSGSTFAVTKSVIAAGSSQSSSGGSFALAGTIGQSVAGNSLTGGSFALNSGFWSPTVYNVGLEGDIAARSSGNGAVESNDVVLVRRLFNGTALIDYEYNEFQRADSAPRATFGDGAINSADIVQAHRYQNTTDAPHVAAGPAEQGASPRVAAGEEQTENIRAAEQQMSAPRQVRVESTSAIAGQTVTINIRVDAAGDEAGYGFILNYDKTKLTNPVIGAGNAGAAVRACNLNFSTGINCAVDTFPVNNPNSTDASIGEIAAGENQILITVTFNVAMNAPPVLNLTLSNVNASNDNADLVAISGADGTLMVSGGPTAAPVVVGGQILTADGRGIRNVPVKMTDGSGQTRTALSSINGRFRFADVAPGAVYIFAVSAKRFRFAQDKQVLVINEDKDDINFTAEAGDAPPETEK